MTNEAAERLLDHVWDEDREEAESLLRQALAAERRATVERISTAVAIAFDEGHLPLEVRMTLDAILDAEADR